MVCISLLLYLLVSTRAVIGQFSGPYSPVRPSKLAKVDSVANLFCDLSPTVLNFHSKNLKLFFTLNYVLKRAND